MIRQSGLVNMPILANFSVKMRQRWYWQLNISCSEPFNHETARPQIRRFGFCGGTGPMRYAGRLFWNGYPARATGFRSRQRLLDSHLRRGDTGPVCQPP